MCVCVCVCVCVTVSVCVLRIVSRDKILRFKNTFIIIIIYRIGNMQEGRMEQRERKERRAAGRYEL